MNRIQALWRFSRIVLAVAIFSIAVSCFLNLQWYLIPRYLSLRDPVKAEVSIWLPSKYAVLNQMADGSYLKIARIDDTNVVVPFSAYHILSAQGENTVVVMGNGYVNYFTRVSNVVFRYSQQFDFTAVTNKFAYAPKLYDATITSKHTLLLHGSQPTLRDYLIWIILTGALLVGVAYFWKLARWIYPPKFVPRVAVSKEAA